MDRLLILKDAGVISENAYDIGSKYNKYLLNIFEESELYDMFITHLVMAIKREEENEKVESISDEIFVQIKSSERYQTAKSILNELNKIHKLQEKEERYILLHLINLLDI